jgi:hypothetical protein
MKLLTKALNVCLFLFSITLSYGQSLNGAWQNEKNEGIVRLIISGESKVQAFGKCSPKDCDWGTTPLRRARQINGGSLTTAVFDSRVAKRTLSFASINANRLQVKVATDYHDKRPTRNNTYYFRKGSPNRVRTIPTNTNNQPSSVREDYYEVTLHNIKCVDSDDYAGDEMRAIFLRDDEPAFRMSKNDLDNGEQMNIERKFIFKDVFTIKIYDDEVAADDFLGQFRLDKLSPGRQTKSFRGSSSRYHLTFTAVKKQKTTSTRPRNLRIELIDVTCDETEDHTGNDDFYLLGGVVLGDRSGSILTQPISINNNENKAFQVSQRTIYNGPIPSNASRLSIGFVAKEEDAGAVWKRNGQRYLELAQNIGRSIDDLTNETGVESDLAEDIASNATEAFGEILRADADDELGRLALDFDVSDLKIDDETIHWTFSEDGARYTVRFRITGLR